jgi:hypothetical protein
VKSQPSAASVWKTNVTSDPRVVGLNDYSIWHPIKGPVEERPIAVCDGRSVDTSRLIEVDITRGRYTGTVQYVLYDSMKPFHWYYMSRQSDE